MLRRFTVLLFFCLVAVASVSAQNLIDPDRNPVYYQVFEDTDNFGASYLYELEQALPHIKADTIKYAVLNDLAYYWHTRDLNLARQYAKRGLELVKGGNSKPWEGKFQMTEASILLRMEKLDSAFYLLEEARTKVRKTDLPFLMTQLGYVFERKGDLVKAADYALETKTLGENLNDVKAQAVAYSDLSNLFWKHSKFEKGLEYGLTSLEFFESRGINDLDYDFTLYVVGNNLLSLERYEEALTYYEHSIAIGERYGFYNNLSDVYISLVDLYAYFNEYTKAEQAAEKAIEFSTRLNNNFMLMRSWLAAGNLQILQGKYGAAITSLNQCIEIATPSFGDKFYLSQAYGRLGKAYAGNHNYKDAYEAFAKYDILKSQVFTEDSSQKMSVLQTEFDLAQKDTTIQGMEDRIQRQRSSQLLISVIAVLLLVLLLVLYVTYQNNSKKNVLLEQKNQEKEFLLKEIHHRVKNNLGIVSSLLDLQAEKIEDPKVVAAILESRNRVYSMSMIHQKLYQGKDLSSIGMKDYLINLSKHISDSFGANKNIEVDYHLQNLDLNVDHAIPVGLIVNELLTNSYKHGFTIGEEGRIQLTFVKINKQKILLEVSDSGRGMEVENFELNSSSGFGTQLISLLIDQLDGSIHIQNGQGTRVSMEFSSEMLLV